MIEEKWDRRFMALAEHIAQWSKDPSTKVGAVLVDPITRLVHGMGYNGFPRGVDDAPYRYADRELKYAMVVHAEANALMNAHPGKLAALVLYATKFPCSGCAKLIIQAGLAAVVVLAEDPNDPAVMRWAKDASISRTMFREANVRLIEMPPG